MTNSFVERHPKVFGSISVAMSNVKWTSILGWNQFVTDNLVALIVMQSIDFQSYLRIHSKSASNTK